MRSSTLNELAQAMGMAAPMPTTYGSFAAFTDTITAAGQTLRREQNLRRVVREVIEDSAGQGAVWVEPSMCPAMLRGRLGSHAEAADIVLDAGRAAANEYGIGFGLILAANRDRGPDEAVTVAHFGRVPGSTVEPASTCAPTSSAKLSVVASLEDHPLPTLLAAGVRCSLNADDPLLFATDLTDEYQRGRDRMHLSDAQLAAIACTSLEASAAPRDVVRHSVQEIQVWLGSDTGEINRAIDDGA